MKSETLSETEHWKGSRTEKNGSPGKLKMIMKGCCKKTKSMWSVKKVDFAQDDNNKLSSDNQKLLIFQKQTVKELYTLSCIPRDD